MSAAVRLEHLTLNLSPLAQRTLSASRVREYLKRHASTGRSMSVYPVNPDYSIESTANQVIFCTDLRAQITTVRLRDEDMAASLPFVPLAITHD
jgi:hypothetical protein